MINIPLSFHNLKFTKFPKFKTLASWRYFKEEWKYNLTHSGRVGLAYFSHVDLIFIQFDYLDLVC